MPRKDLHFLEYVHMILFVYIKVTVLDFINQNWSVEFWRKFPECTRGSFFTTRVSDPPILKILRNN